MPEDCDVGENLLICTDDEDDWKEFLQLCTRSFQNSVPFKRSLPDIAKREKFVKEYFAYLYETEFSRERAGLVCVKRRSASGKEKIIYGLVGMYNGSEISAGDKSRMLSIDRVATDIALKYDNVSPMIRNQSRYDQQLIEFFFSREDEWIRKNIRNKMSEISESIGFPWIYYALQTSKYRNHGLATKYFQNAAQMIYQDGIRRGKMLRLGVDGVAYTVLDDYTVHDFYTKVGMIEIAHRHIKGESAMKCKDDFSDNEQNRDCDCLFLMYAGFPKWNCYEEQLKRFFQSVET